ncbi:Carboxylesterase 5A [Balamuthia mandrillaris]
MQTSGLPSTSFFFFSFITFLLFLNGCTVLADHGPVVETAQGAVRGHVVEGQNGKNRVEFLGIPFAKPPVGPLRWEAPVTPDAWNQTLNLSHVIPPACSQTVLQSYTNTNITIDRSPVSEDCLYLNIWTPEEVNEDSALDVVVWIHGGALTSGGTQFSPLGHMVDETGLIFVSIAYRLGVLGFLSFDGVEDANLGILDQRLALQWISQNIAAFGGNPNSITIIGHSAGGMSVLFHLVNDEISSLFHRAIIMSPGTFYIFPPSQLETVSARLATTLECETLSCLREYNATELIKAASDDGTFFTAIVGEDSIPYHPLNRIVDGHYNKDIDVIFGEVDQEGNFILMGIIGAPFDMQEFVYDFALGAYFPEDAQQIADLYVPVSDEEGFWNAGAKVTGDSNLLCGTDFVIRAMASHGTNVYRYLFTHRPIHAPADYLNCTHGSEVPFFFLDPHAYHLQEVLVSRFSTEEEAFSRRIVNLWTSFAKTGEPTDSENEEFVWPLWDNDEQQVTLFNLDVETVTYDNSRVYYCYEFWNDFFGVNTTSFYSDSSSGSNEDGSHAASLSPFQTILF